MGLLGKGSEQCTTELGSYLMGMLHNPEGESWGIFIVEVPWEVLSPRTR